LQEEKVMQKTIRLAAGLAATILIAASAFGQAAPPPAPASQDPIVKGQQQRSVNQPGNNSEVWREVRSGESHFTSVPGREMGVLQQQQARFPGQDQMSTAGEAWRKFKNGPVTFWGGWLLVAVIAIIAGIYFAMGPITAHEPESGRMILRFTRLERWTHWTVAISFCTLGITGIFIMFGKFLLLPIIGYTLNAWLLQFSKALHNFVAPVFMVSLVVFIVVYVKDNLPEKGDLHWLLNAWKMFRSEHLPSGRFNAGEKAWFWGGVVVLSLVIVGSGLVLLFPNFDQVRTTMQQAHIIHVVCAVLVMAAALGHIYMGTIGVEGAYRNMRDGYTDEVWAKAHHENWYREVMSGKRPATEAEAGATAQPQHQGGTT
jgi:formate dehydrogenase subunit gamma